MARLCMFHPVGHPMERGWVGRVDGDRVVHLAAQTLQSFFTGGGSAREHAEYPVADVVLLAPVLHPPSVRVFEDETTFAFANPAAVVGPHAVVTPPRDTSPHGLVALARVAAVMGVGGSIGGFTGCVELRAPDLPPPKDRDFATATGPVVVTPDELNLEGFDWGAATALAAAGTRLYPGDVLAGPGTPVDVSARLAVELAGIGVLELTIGP
ncbi:MAG TPA: hypothetical protein VFU99_00280 [Gaiellaceae bacterium]|nr:hypothetical protein [Gaiellaceae bacterium]